MSFQSNLDALITILNYEDDPNEFEKDIIDTFPDPSEADKSLDIATAFVNSFSQYLSIPAFSTVLSKIVSGTYEICETINEFDDLLIRNLLFRLSEIKSEYARSVEMVGKTISDCLSGLPNQVIAINIGIFLLPVFKEEGFATWFASNQMKEVVRIDNSKVALKIKGEVDAWLKTLDLNSRTQEEFQEELKELVNAKAEQYNLDTRSEDFERLIMECDEMLAMKLTVLSLMMGFEDDEDLTPVPLNL